jgi:hypothetical protein
MAYSRQVIFPTRNPGARTGPVNEWNRLFSSMWPVTVSKERAVWCPEGLSSAAVLETLAALAA